MYRQGLGDCFLLTFAGTDRPVHMLIDCGVIVGTPDAGDVMKRVAADIKVATGGSATRRGHLDVVVVTHEHWDHISGFAQARDIFEKEIDVDQIWFGWTEEPGNVRAQELKDEFGFQKRGLQQALGRWAGTGLQPALREAVTEVVSFFGDSLAAGGHTTQDAMARLTGRQGADFQYLVPGQTPFAVPGVEGVRVYVLGPPSEAAFINRLLPRKTQHEAYELRLSPARAFLAALGEPALAGGESEEQRRLAYPFDEYHRIPRAQAQGRTDDFFRQHYGFSSDPVNEWRRIDDDWLTVAGHLALDLDNWTNNTCLALAFEIVATGDVLLFPGDAQVGNWASWKNVSFTVPDDHGGVKTVTARDLLQRTVLYKVGHHGSHNATHRSEGLELMESPELVAMIPVNHEMAKKKKWNMPFPPLLKRLEEKCHGRVIHQDRPIEDAVASAGKVLSKRKAARFKRRVDGTDLFVECKFP